VAHVRHSDLAIILISFAVRIFCHLPVPLLASPSRITAWACLLVAILMPGVVFRLLLWNKQPWFCESRGLIVTLWIPSAAAADAIQTHMRPLIERATRSSVIPS
jgi:hypothetical protein